VGHPHTDSLGQFWDTMNCHKKQEFLCQIYAQTFQLQKTTVLIANFRPYIYPQVAQNAPRYRSKESIDGDNYEARKRKMASEVPEERLQNAVQNVFKKDRC